MTRDPFHPGCWRSVAGRVMDLAREILHSRRALVAEPSSVGLGGICSLNDDALALLRAAGGRGGLL